MLIKSDLYTSHLRVAHLCHVRQHKADASRLRHSDRHRGDDVRYSVRFAATRIGRCVNFRQAATTGHADPYGLGLLCDARHISHQQPLPWVIHLRRRRPSTWSLDHVLLRRLSHSRQHPVVSQPVQRMAVATVWHRRQSDENADEGFSLLLPRVSCCHQSAPKCTPPHKLC